MSEVDDLFKPQGAPAFKFASVGDKIKGKITDLEARQSREFGGGEGETWPDGRPKMELVITIQALDPTEEDDGKRRVFCRGQMLIAMREAMREAGETAPRVGGQIAIAHTGLGEQKTPGFNPPKLYAVAYKPGPQSEVADLLKEQSPAATATGTEGVDAAGLAALLDES